MRHAPLLLSRPRRQCRARQQGLREQWPDAELKDEYGVVIVGAGGHGLGTAYDLAKEHGLSRVAIIDKGWLGGGNTGRNTTITRSNYLYERATKLWEGPSQELNDNVTFSQRGVMMLAHTVHDEQSFKRHIHSNRLNGIDNEWLTLQQAQDFCPPLERDARPLDRPGGDPRRPGPGGRHGPRADAGRDPRGDGRRGRVLRPRGPAAGDVREGTMHASTMDQRSAPSSRAPIEVPRRLAMAMAPDCARFALRMGREGREAAGRALGLPLPARIGGMGNAGERTALCLGPDE